MSQSAGLSMVLKRRSSDYNARSKKRRCSGSSFRRFHWVCDSAENPILAGVGAEALIGAGNIAAEEPAATVWRGAAGGVKEAGDFGGEALPQGGAERDRAVAEGERVFLRCPQVER